MAHVEIDLRRTAGRIEPFWFGHNLEHTRACLWHGLSAQLLSNRKFAAVQDLDGVGAHWRRIGPPGCLFMLERTLGRWNTQGEAYVREFQATGRQRHGAMQRQRIQSYRSGERAGICQGGLFLRGGMGYKGFLALLSDRPLTARAAVLGGHGTLFEEVREVRPGAWTEWDFAFRAAAREPDARLEVTFDGPGMLCVGAASLLPADHFHGMRRDVIELLRQITVPLLRWPGGNFAGSYLWEDGLLPVHRRAPLSGSGILPYTNGCDEHEIGTDEFVALCRELGAEPWITINMSVQGAPEAAAWVEYCNGPADTEWGARRAERGHPEPYGVRYWSLGNEMGYGHMVGPNAPPAYAAAARDCAQAMRAADPSIVLTASGRWNQPEWPELVLAQIGDCFEHVSFHEYAPMLKDFEGEAGRREFLQLATWPERTFETIRQVRAQLDAHAPSGKFVGIAFDEWNLWHAWFREPGVMEGIYTASMLSAFCRRAREVGMTFGAYFEPVNEGAIRVEPDGARLTPAGRVFALFAAHHGNDLIETQCDEGALDAVASYSGAAGEVVLTLVNRDPAEEARARVRIAGAGAASVTEAAVLTAPDFRPESQFALRKLDVATGTDAVLTATVPPHSVARVRLACRSHRPGRPAP